MNAMYKFAAIAAIGGVSLGLSPAPLAASGPQVLRVCADPGNMPMSNTRREGYQNKIAELLADSIGAGVQYYWKPFIERGLTRTTLDADQCDLMFDMPPDMERVLTTVPLYRTTFVLAYRKDSAYDFKSLDDERLKTMKLGVFQVSSARTALAEHGVKNNTVIHFLSYDADLVPEHQPGYQVQQVLNGELDAAAVWGPFAGWYVSMKKQPLTLQPMNVLDDEPMEFSMSIAMRTRDKKLKAAIDDALVQNREAIRKILTDYGVPLVACSDCVVSGTLPSHGPYAPREKRMTAAQAYRSEGTTVTTTDVDNWLKEGAKVDDEFNDAVIAADIPRMDYLLGKGAHINARDPQGETALINAVRKLDPVTTKALLERGADVNIADRDGWTAALYAAWGNSAELIDLLAARGANLEATNPNGLTALCIASQYGKTAAANALIRAGAQVNLAVGKAAYTPLMLAVLAGAGETAQLLIERGANVNARNAGGVTALMIAAAGNRAESAALLLKAGANPALSTEDGRTAASIARDQNAVAVMQLLESHRGTNADASGSTTAPRS